ncbi:MAG TPA: hypothetical protein VJU86_00935 [Pyrinomonadaceae bacterium]|nr:hypothetical protein [Pyrinomonadaceae bacterium]
MIPSATVAFCHDQQSHGPAKTKITGDRGGLVIDVQQEFVGNSTNLDIYALTRKLLLESLLHG